MLLIDNDLSARLLTIRETMDALEAVFREEGLGAATCRTKANIHIPAAGDEWYRYCSMEGGSRGLGVVAIRIKSDMSSVPLLFGQRREQYYASRPGKYCGLILLFSAVNGEPLAILNDGVIQHLRVGATYGLAARHMARADAKSLGIIGSGGMARSYAEAVALVRPLERVQVYSPNRANLDRYVAEMTERLGIPVVAAVSAAEAAAGVDMLAAMTDALEPLIFPEMIRPGMHVCAVQAQHTEVAPAALERMDWAVTYRSGTGTHHYTTPDTWMPPQPGGTTAISVAAEERALGGRPHRFTDVLLGKVPGRRRDEEITYFTGEGTGTQFAATAKLAYERAREQGLGRELPLDWFLQDIRN